MKAPPKRKGNAVLVVHCGLGHCLNESPSEKEGKLTAFAQSLHSPLSLNESPSEKEGKSEVVTLIPSDGWASMKAPPKRKGNY